MSVTVESKLIEKAINALLKWQEKQQNKSEELIEQQEYIYCIVTLAKMPSKLQVKPIRIPLKHSIHPGANVCVISKDPQSDYKPKLDCKVIGVSKLKQKYKAFEEKRLLSSSYDLFLADKRVLPVLPRLLGKSFFLKKKYYSINFRQPIPIDLTKDNLKQELLDVLSGTFLYLNKGTCWYF
jgi:ribosome biogenesis protein UTP30